MCYSMAPQKAPVRQGTRVYNTWYLALARGVSARRCSSTTTTRLRAVGTEGRFLHKSPTYCSCSHLSVPWLSFDSEATSSLIMSGRGRGSWPPPPCHSPPGASGRKTWQGDTSSHVTSYDNCIVIINYRVFFLVFFILLHRSTQAM